MSNSRRWFFFSSVIAIAFAVSVGGYLLYQKHLSGDVRRLLIAANDQNASVLEVRGYVAQARPLVRTNKDRQTLETFEKGISLMMQVQEDQRKDEEEFRDTLHSLGNLMNGDETDKCMGHMYALINVEKHYAEDHMKAPQSLLDDVQAAYKDGKQCEADDEKESQARSQREKKNNELAMQCFNSVRATLGLPQIPMEKNSDRNSKAGGGV